jgi:hypothetical protein
MLNTVSAALEIFRRKVIPFERTPKYGILRRGQDWRATRYRVKTESVVFLELGLAGFTLITALLAWEAQHWLMMTYSLLFSTALVFASGFTLAQALSQRLRARSRV